VNHPFDIACLGSLVGPIAMVICLKSVLYDGWRHLYFIYPAFLFFAVVGLFTLWQGAARLGASRWAARTILGLATATALAQVMLVMIEIHPFQNVYFNRLAGSTLDKIRKRYEVDYWGLSRRQALEKLLAQIPAGEMRVEDSMPTRNNVEMLPETLRKRIRLVGRKDAFSESQPTYFLSNYRGHPDDFPTELDVTFIQVYDSRICFVGKYPASQTGQASRAQTCVVTSAPRFP
jgi:hypothetical protein